MIPSVLRRDNLRVARQTIGTYKEGGMKTKIITGFALRAVLTMMCGASIVSAETALVAEGRDDDGHRASG